MVVIQVEKVPQAIIDAAYPEMPPGSCSGLTLHPVDNGAPFRGFRKLTVYVREGMSQYRTRQVIAHEMIHVVQYLTGCEVDEEHANNLDEVLAAALKPRAKKKDE